MVQHQIKQAKGAQNLQEEYKFTAQDDFQSNVWSLSGLNRFGRCTWDLKDVQYITD